MTRTPASLLERLRRPNAQSAWSRFVKLYTPLVYRWARTAGLSPQDASDLVQDVFVVLVEKLPELQYDHDKSFRAWLPTVTINKWRDRCRRLGAAPKLVAGQDPALIATADPAWLDETQYRQQLVVEAMATLRDDFRPATWKAFHECAVVGRPSGEVETELGLSLNAVYLARSRVIRRLREELDGLID
jgi:RNA polymerase sigma-70 factor (ECF subfamily)